MATNHLTIVLGFRVLSCSANSVPLQAVIQHAILVMGRFALAPLLELEPAGAFVVWHLFDCGVGFGQWDPFRTGPGMF